MLAEFTKMTMTQRSLGKHPLLTLTNNLYCHLMFLVFSNHHPSSVYEVGGICDLKA